jgi:hypothetical protein
MPMKRQTAPPGSLTEEGRETVQRDELPEGAQATAEDDSPRFLVHVTVPEGALSGRRKAGLVALAKGRRGDA